jgi:hypothetical protein
MTAWAECYDGWLKKKDASLWRLPLVWTDLTVDITRVLRQPASLIQCKGVVLCAGGSESQPPVSGPAVYQLGCSRCRLDPCSK